MVLRWVRRFLAESWREIRVVSAWRLADFEVCSCELERFTRMGARFEPELGCMVRERLALSKHGIDGVAKCQGHALAEAY
jgi:hypothetical protein